MTNYERICADKAFCAATIADVIGEDFFDKTMEWLDAYNENLPELIELYGGDCRKISADYYCDDKNYWLMPEGD